LDFQMGDVLLKAKDRLTSFRLALAASMNHASLPVIERPKVALISTGDELVMPGQATGPGQIIASNTFGLGASVENVGAVLHDFGIVEDTHNALEGIFQSALDADCDLILTTGGASVGDHDLVLPVAEKLGFIFEITKIAMRPGKPFLFGKLQRDGKTVYLCGLAGNPVSSLVAFHVFVRPLIQTLSGQTAEAVTMQTAVLGRDMPQNDERAEFMRATVEKGANGALIATAFESQDSSMLANLVRADCLLYRPVHAPFAPKGSPCKIVFIA
ncbi:MAG: molybdopterin molybdotransferase MoeA, partial [Pseudomonadota bacterium]